MIKHNLHFPDPAYNSIYLLTQTNAAIWRTVEEKLCDEDKDINIAQIRILTILYHHNRPLTSVEICHCVFRKSQTITVSINRLNEKGYVKKTFDQNDKRYVLIQITEKGKQIIQKYSLWMAPLINDIMNCFSEDELKQFEKHINKLYNCVFQLLGINLVEPIDGFHGNKCTKQFVEATLNGIDNRPQNNQVCELAHPSRR